MSAAFDIDERLLRALLGKIQQLQTDVFEHPPKTIEEFNIRLGRYLELRDLTKMMIQDAKGIEKGMK